MTRKDRLLIHHQGDSAQEMILHDVCCTEQEGIAADSGGFALNGHMMVHIFSQEKPPVSCGDRIRRIGSDQWYTVAEIRRHVRPDGGLVHWKIVSKQ